MTTLLEAAKRDRNQMQNEVGETEREQLGPPRRLPLPQEKQPTHLRMQAMVSLQNTILELQHYIGLAEERKNQSAEQMLVLAKSLAVFNERRDELDQILLGKNRQLGNLPIVIGRSISLIPGSDPLTTAPLKTLQAVTQQSKFVQTREMVAYAMKTHKERVLLDQQLWVSKQNSTEIKSEANYVVNRLAEISDRMKRSTLQGMKLNLLEAIGVFQQRGVELHHIAAKEAGLLRWYTSMDESLSKDCTCFTASTLTGEMLFEIDSLLAKESQQVSSVTPASGLSDGVTLAAGSSEGISTGVVLLPKVALWNFLLTVSIEAELNDPESQESVSIFLGPSLDALVNIGTYRNSINPETGSILFDVMHAMRTDALAFRFEFVSNSDGPHMRVGMGLFEQFEMKPLEFFFDSLGRERVLSSLVKTMRIDEKQGKFRETKLLEELIALEGSTSDYWDSDLITSSPQRYGRDYYIRILKVEILLEQRAGNAALASLLETKTKAKLARNSNRIMSNQELAVDQSKTEFMMRKRARQSHVLEQGALIVKRRIEIFDEEQSRWRHVLVKSCVIRWLDNGLTAKCTHMLQEHNEGNELLGVEFEVDLAKVRWFEAAVQDIDEVAMEKWRRQRKYEGRLKEIASIMESQVMDLRSAYNAYRKEEEEALRHQVARVSNKLEKNIKRLAQLRSEEPDAHRLIKQGISPVLLEMKMGVLKINPDMKPGVQALQISKERFIEKWIIEKRQQVVQELLILEREVEQRINERRAEFIDMERSVVEEANKERYGLLAQTREYKLQEKAKLMERVKIDKNKFQLALPKTRVCAHLKTKAWGEKYSKGVRCVACGKELSEVHLEESQTLGYGTGTDEWLYLAIKRHRSDEASFRFNNAQELKVVEDERLHLEKERREMEDAEAFFYDFQDLSIVYDFDRRHAKFIKDAGIFRQGLQWTQEELRQFERKSVAVEKERIAQDNLVETTIEKFDPLSAIAEPPPTFRAADERRKAQYSEFMFMMGRLHTYQKKVALLKEQRLEMLAGRKMYSSVLEHLHKESYAFDAELEGIEQDLDRTGLLLATFERMQALWRQATRIMAQADRDMRKAAMKHCGVWEDVEETHEAYVFVHDEVLELLKIIFFLESNKGSNSFVLEAEERLLAFKTGRMEQLFSEASAAEYCRPGDPVLTKYGMGWIRDYRARDGMLLVTLSFGSPSAKLWIRAQEWIDTERSRQAGELMLMVIEDESSAVWSRKEKVSSRRERLGMQASEHGLRDYYTFVGLGEKEDDVLFRSIEHAVQDQFGRLETANFKRKQEALLHFKVETWKKEGRMIYDDYVGPVSGRPKKPTMWRVYQYRQEMNQELRVKFLVAAACDAEKSALKAFHKVRSDWVQKYTFEQLIDSEVCAWAKEIAAETHREGRIAKLSAEHMSGIAIPNPRSMQFDMYRSLVDIWKRRKLELKTLVEVSRGAAATTKKVDAKEELNNEDVVKIKARKRLIRVEKRRQLTLNAILAVEEMLARKFYKWELSENLRERRQMSQEERETKAYLRALEKAERAARSARMAIQSSIPLVTANTAEARRAQLKELTLERRHREEVQAYMILEDKFGMLLREVDRVLRQNALIAKAMGQDFVEDNPVGALVPHGEVADSMTVDIPPWMVTVPLDWDNWSILKQRQFIADQNDNRKRTLSTLKNVTLEEKRLEKIEDRAYRGWKSSFDVLKLEAVETELTVMSLQEQSRQIEYDLREIEANIRTVATFVREKGEEELKINAVLRKQEQYARRREKELKEATAWFELCVKRARKRDKVKRRVVANCLWIDTDSITGFQQRFETVRLRERLYWVYFRRITAQIVTRAEIIATERRLFAVQEQLSSNKATLLERSWQMKERWKEIQRDEYLRMRKSLLNRKIFPQHRREVLQQRFGSWVRFYLWNRGHREAYELRYEVLKRQMDIQRQFRVQLGPRENVKRAAARHLSSKLDSEAVSAVLSSGTGPLAGSEETPMQRHREHPVQCSVCRSLYLDSQNQSLSCAYHPGVLAMDCPSTCPAPGMTALCQSHRIRRWKCCDSIKADSLGCARRNHIAAPVDALYEKVMSSVRQRDQDVINGLDDKLDAARIQNWPLQMMKVKRGQVSTIEESISNTREKGNRFYNLKYF